MRVIDPLLLVIIFEQLISMDLRITEIFLSIQGESSHAGRPCSFVRLTGCPMRCVWCDSEYTFTGGEQMSFEEIFAETRRIWLSTWSRSPAANRSHRRTFFLLSRNFAIAAMKCLIETGGFVSTEECRRAGGDNSRRKMPGLRRSGAKSLAKSRTAPARDG